MKERPILFNDAMVRALLAGRKTQTRRICNPQPDSARVSLAQCSRGPILPNALKGGYYCVPCRYGKPGDRLWVRETWAPDYCDPVEWHVAEDRDYYFMFRADGGYKSVVGALDSEDPEWDAKHDWFHDKLNKGDHWRPSIHMPRWACRTVLEIVDVRIERLLDISEADAIAEGVALQDCHASRLRAKEWFEKLWDSINGTGAAEKNPWVWVVEFKRLEGVS